MKAKTLLLAAILVAIAIASVIWMLPTNEKNAAADLMFYGRACLGPDKTNPDLILHFIVKGSDIFLDRNKDDVAEPSELLSTNQLELLEDKASGVTYHVKELRLTKNLQIVSTDVPQTLAMTVGISGKVDYEQIGQFAMSLDPATPDWIHFHGNNRLIFADSDLPLTAGEKVQLRTFFGTNAVGDGRDLGTPAMVSPDDAAKLAAMNEDQRFATILPQASSIFPELVIEIPTAGEPFKERIPLNEFC